MRDVSVATSAKPGLWRWLLRATGLEAWFRRAPAAAHAGQEERIVLLLALAGTTRATRAAHAALLARAQQACQASLAASGGTALEYQPGILLLTWPAATESRVPIVALYFQLRDCLRQLANAPALGLEAAAGLGWAAPAALAWQQYEPASLREVASLLHESRQLGSELLLTAALRQRLAPAVAGQCALHVAFEVPGHRYPATVYRAVAPGTAPPLPKAAGPIADQNERMAPLTKKYSY